MNKNNNVSDLELFEKILEKAAEKLGDIHPLILQRFFAEHPSASEVFSQHGGIHMASMQNTMIDWGLYCLMGWLDYKGEAMNALTDAVRQHEHSEIEPQLTRGLMSSIFAVIGQSIDSSDISELRLWNRIESEILDFLVKTEASLCTG